MSSYRSSTSSVSRHGRYVTCRVTMLDDTDVAFEIPNKSVGQVLFDSVVKKLQLLEADYFGLEYFDAESIPCWLDYEKLVIKQVHINDLNFRFLVKFYTPDPELLEEELTRYLFALQIKRDLASGSLACQEHTAVLLASFVAQAEVGNFCDELYDQGYLASLKLLPNQSLQVERKIIDHHKEHSGLTPADADFSLLDTARKVEMYGIRPVPAKDHDGISLRLAVAHVGILVFQNVTKINAFSWAKIRKLCFKRKKFVIKLHPDGTAYTKDTVEFYLPSRNWAKNFWKRCIEHHSFFRCHSARHEGKRHGKVVSRGSSFRYSGKTQKELCEYVRDNYVAPTPFERSTSMRTISMLGSRMSTPRYGTLNSHRDLPYDSRTLDRSQSGTLDRLASGSARLAGSCSRNNNGYSRSATLDRSRHGSTERVLDDGGDMENVNAMTRGNSFQTFQGQQRPTGFDGRVGGREPEPTGWSGATGEPIGFSSVNSRFTGYPQVNHRGETLPTRSHKIDPSQFMLSRDATNSQSQLPTLPPGTPPCRVAGTPPLRVAGTPPGRIAGSRPSPADGPPTGRAPGLPPTGAGVSASPSHSGSLRLHSHSSASLPSTTAEANASAALSRLPRQERVEAQSAAMDDLPLPPPPMSLIPDDRTALVRSRPLYDHTPLVSEPRSPPLPPPPSTTLNQSCVPCPPCLSSPPCVLSPPCVTSPTCVSGPQSPVSSPTDESEDVCLSQRFTADEPYYVVKELLMTERTYKKDLEVISVWFQDSVSRLATMPSYLSDLLFGTLVPIYDFHCSFLKDVEQRLAVWESSPMVTDGRRIADLLLRNMSVLQFYRDHLDRHEDILAQFDLAARRLVDFQRTIDEFESQKICYLPLIMFLLKPVQRLLHYQLLLNRLLKHYTPDHLDVKDCKACLVLINGVVLPYREKLKYVINWQKLIDVQHSVTGLENVVHANRQFVREGCLQKLSRKGFQQRMVFLFSDILLYASRTSATNLQFKIHGQLAVAGSSVKDTDPETAVSTPFSFTVTSDNKCLVFAAGSQEEKDKWMEDLAVAAQTAHVVDDQNNVTAAGRILYPSLKSNSSSEGLDDSSPDPNTVSPLDRQIQLQHRANTTIHVCWHRNTSIGARDLQISLQNQLSGFLLRKFKNSSGWQKLWVVFTNFCLFFYKGFQDDVPLASLPLLGYSVSTPNEADSVRRDYVFKLQFKNHVYFFRAESLYTFDRWMEVIKSATSTARLLRTFSRLDSNAKSPPPVATNSPASHEF